MRTEQEPASATWPSVEQRKNWDRRRARQRSPAASGIEDVVKKMNTDELKASLQKAGETILEYAAENRRLKERNAQLLTLVTVVTFIAIGCVAVAVAMSGWAIASSP